MQERNSFTFKQKRMLFLSALGGALEFYDFIIYIFLAPMIEKVFFADSSAYLATIKTLTIFAIGYLFRPLGGIIFSHFGDRYGRKVVFLLTVIFMAVPSFAMGLLPTPAQIGLASPIMLLLLRMIQGLALGGEIPAAITFVSEHIPKNRHGFALSILFFGINVGLMLGSFVTTLMISSLSATEMLKFGWRIPFILGGILGITSVFMRRHLHETEAFSALSKQDLQRIPLFTLLKDSPTKIIRGMCLVAVGSTSVFLYLYWPQYLNTYMGFDFNTIMRINTACTFILNIFILIGGLVADRMGTRHLYLLCTGFLILFTYPLFYIFSLHSLTLAALSYIIFSLAFGFIPGTYTSIISGLFPTSMRYSGIAMSYNLAFAIFGGLSPLICTFAIHYFNTALAPAFYVTSVASLSWLACYSLQKRVITPTLQPAKI